LPQVSEAVETEDFRVQRLLLAQANAVEPYSENPPDRVIDADDIVFCAGRLGCRPRLLPCPPRRDG
jgi:hypothetical protein